VRLENEFTVAAPLERTWQVLLDVERVAGCLPGATVEPVGEEGLYRGQMRLKVGPVNMAYSGTVQLLDVDADEHVASFEARAKETRGTGTAAATIRNRLEPADGGTRVRVETDLDVTGRPAQFGRGLMQDVASKMLGEFAGRLEHLVLEPAANGADRAPAPPRAPGDEAAAGEVSPQPSRTGDETRFDVGSMLLRGYGRQLAIGGSLLALLLAALLRRRNRGLTITVRYRA